jgi:hypothetical protein
MIRNLKEKDDFYLVCGKPTDSVEIIARLVLETRTPSKIDLIVQDCTGSASVIFYKKPTEENEPRSMRNFVFESHAYVKIFAQIKKVQGQINLIGTHIETIRSRSTINEFYTTILISTLKPSTKHNSLTSEILQTIKSLNPSSNRIGVTIQEIHTGLNFKYQLKILEDHCNQLQSENILSIGKDWNHYLVNN